jgi:hypothetical protein
MYIPKKRSHFGMESFKLCKAKTGHVWNMLWYTGKDTEQKNEVLGIDISHYSKLSKTVFTLAEKLLRQGYIIGLDNYYSSPELFDTLNKLETDAVGTVRCNRKGLLRDIMGKKLKKEEVAVSFRRMLMALIWKDKRDVCMLSSTHDEEMQTVRDKKGGEKQKLKVSINYNDAMGGADLSDQYIVTYSTTRKRIKKYYQKTFHQLLDLLDLMVFNSFVTLHDVSPPTGISKQASKRCVVCMGKEKWKDTKYRCNECNVLCPAPCFRIYHSLQDQ